MKRRPSNPKRVDEDGKSVSSEHLSSPHTGSSESPVTVIHEDGANARTPNITGEEAAGNEGVSPTRDQDPTGKNRRDINWEVELQKYFRTFDEHVRNQNDPTDGGEYRPISEEANLPQAEASYGKISRSSSAQNAFSASGSGEKQQGAKPKTKKFGSAFTEEEIRASYELFHMKVVASGNAAKDIDIDEVRKLRLAKFQEGSESEPVNNETNIADQEVKKKHQRKKENQE